MAAKSVIAVSAEEIEVIFSVWHVKTRKLALSERKTHVASPGDFMRVFYCLRTAREKRAHFILGFEVEFIGLKLHFTFVVDGGVCLNTKQDSVSFAVLALGVVAVVCSNKLGADFIGYFYQARYYSLFLGYVVVLKLDEKVIFSEQVLIIPRLFKCAAVVVVQKLLRDFAGKTRG